MKEDNYYTTSTVYELAHKKATDLIDEKTINLCTKILEKIIQTTTTLIYYHIDVHKKLYLENRDYCEFINNIFDEKDLIKHIKIGESQNYLKIINNVRSLGLATIGRKLFKTDNKNIYNNAKNYYENISKVLYALNLSKNNIGTFPTNFLAFTIIEKATIETYYKIVSDYKI